MSVLPPASYPGLDEGLWPAVALPIAVVGGQRVGDVPPGHQEEGTPNMPDAADREKDEGGPEADALFIKELQKKKKKRERKKSV